MNLNMDKVVVYPLPFSTNIQIINIHDCFIQFNLQFNAAVGSLFTQVQDPLKNIDTIYINKEELIIVMCI